MLSGCARLFAKEPRAICDERELAEIESAYVAEALTTCAGRRATACAELPAIEAKYAKQREEWIKCR